MPVFVAINNFEVESLSVTEQNVINKTQMNPLGVHFGRNCVLNFVSLFPHSGKGLLVHLVLP